MRKFSVAGSVFCCLPALYILFAVAYDISTFPRDFSNDPTAQVAVIFYAVYVVLAFAPAIMLVKARHIEISRSKVLVVGGIEFVVVIVLLALISLWGV
jgi:uncharacterized membrane protein YhaH (DUF805 family)